LGPLGDEGAFSRVHYPEIRTAVWAATLVAVVVLAFTRGGRSERWAASALFAGWLTTLLVYRYRTGGTEWGVLSVDLALLLVLVWIALRSRRFWPMFAAGFHLLAVVTHVARTVDIHVNHWAYITAEIIWGYLLAFAIGYGAWTAPRHALSGAPVVTVEPGVTRR
jgi:hypothetical protein